MWTNCDVLVFAINIGIQGRIWMGKFTLSLFINRSPQDVFDFLTDPANLSKWNSVMESAEWTSSGVPGVGSTYKVVAKMPWGKKEGLAEIIQWDPPNRYGYKIMAVFPFEDIESVITLAPKDNGTQLTFDAQFRMAGVLRFGDGLFAKLGERGDGSNFETAKRLLEAD
jgi:uncharacterized protein YndB with AHSA1/START domain